MAIAVSIRGRGEVSSPGEWWWGQFDIYYLIFAI
jgi:hypothetical protein